MKNATSLYVGEEVRLPGFVVDLDRAEVRRAEGGRVELRPRSFAVLRLLARNLGQVVPRHALIEDVWDDVAVTDDSLTQCIADIRRALGDRNRTLLRTIARRGYMLLGPEQAPGSAGAPSARGDVPETRYARSGNIHIAYQVSGEGPVDLVFVQGYVTHLEIEWEDPRPAALYEALGGFCRLIRFDKRGTGLSDRVSGLPTLEERMDDVRAVMDAAGSRRAVLLGSSEGGPMSILFAATHPDRVQSLILYGAMARIAWASDHSWGRSQDQLAGMVRAIEEKWGQGHSVDLFAPSIAALPEYRAWRGRLDRSAASPGAAIALARMNFEIDVRHVLSSLHVPVLVLHRADDMAVPVGHGRHLASAVPQARYVELPGRDHAPWVGDTAALVDLISTFALTPDSGAAGTDEILTTVLAVQDAPDAAFRHDAARFRGHVMRAEPGWALALFDGPARAVRCAQAVLASAPQVRAGVHTGDASIRGENATGPAPRIAKAISRAAAPGQVLVTATVRDLVSGSGLAFAPHADLRLAELSSTFALLAAISSAT